MPADDDAPPGVPDWIVTYGDMMSLLLTFFIMLVSMSTIKDDGRMRMMLDAFRARFGAFDGVPGVPGRSLHPNSAYRIMASEGLSSEGGLKRSAQDTAGGGGANRPARSIGHQQVPTLGAPIWFDRFDASLSPDAASDLKRLATALRPLPNRVVIRGHATPEPLPAESPFEDAWDLSFRRAGAVADRLRAAGVAEDRLIVSAAGDTEPRKRGGHDVQDQNRRVDVFVIEFYTTPPGTGP